MISHWEKRLGNICEAKFVKKLNEKVHIESNEWHSKRSNSTRTCFSEPIYEYTSDEVHLIFHSRSKYEPMSSSSVVFERRRPRSQLIFILHMIRHIFRFSSAARLYAIIWPWLEVFFYRMNDRNNICWNHIGTISNEVIDLYTCRINRFIRHSHVRQLSCSVVLHTDCWIEMANMYRCSVFTPSALFIY